MNASTKLKGGSMSEYMHLIGAEQVQSAANSMRQAAHEMQQAASSIQEAVSSQRMLFDNFLTELRDILHPEETTNVRG